MQIGIIGAGWLGGTVGRQWVTAGHQVLFSSRNPAKHADMARRLGPDASTGTIREAARFGEFVLIAVLYGVLPDLGRELEPGLAGKIVLDACNSYPRRLMEASRPRATARIIAALGGLCVRLRRGSR
jgi:predicted dinucleotide-binding enzyme